MSRTRTPKRIPALIAAAFVGLLIVADGSPAIAATSDIAFPRSFSRSLNIEVDVRTGSFPQDTPDAWLLPEGARSVSLRLPAENFALSSIDYVLYGGDREVAGSAPVRSGGTVSVPVPQGFLTQTPLDSGGADGDHFGIRFSGTSPAPVAAPEPYPSGNRLTGDIVLRTTPSAATTASYDLRRPNVLYTESEARAVPTTTNVRLGDTIVLRGHVGSFSVARSGVPGVRVETGLSTVEEMPHTVSADGSTLTITVRDRYPDDGIPFSTGATTLWVETFAGAEGYQHQNDWISVPLVIATPSTDTTAPRITARTPASVATGVRRLTNVTATFSEPVTGYSPTTATITRVSDGSTVAAAVRYGPSSRVLTIDPTRALLWNTQYQVTLTGGGSALRDAAGNPLATQSWRFTTGSAY